MNKPTEQCAYSRLGIQKQVCDEIRCDGFAEKCFHYTTLEHLHKFRGMFNMTPEHPQVQKFREKWGSRKYKCLEAK